jgi:RNA-directed DNA polymerase
MPAAPTAGAASHPVTDWLGINWARASHTVRRLQARIVKATQAGRWGKVHALHHLLTHAFSANALAVRRVTENPGQGPPGIDRAVRDRPEKKRAAIYTLAQHGYHAQPLRRVYIAKSNGKTRPLGIATMKGRAMQALYLLAIDPIAETTGDRNSYGFRRERSTAETIEQGFIVLGRTDRAQWSLEGDIAACFDELSHAWLLAHIPMEKARLRQWLKAGYMERSLWHPTEAGPPQGGPLSPVMANWALDGLANCLREHFPRASRQGRKAKVHRCRYADDWCITGASKELLEQEVKPLVERFLLERGLRLSQEKTKITHLTDGFDFLGHHLRKYHGKLLITPSRQSVKTSMATVRGLIKAHKQLPAGKLIEQLNPRIRGWAHSHRHVVSKATFQRMDGAIFHCLWWWAKRRHPQKGGRWVRKRYFHTLGTRQWCFVGEVKRRGGPTHTITLQRLGDIPIRRHIKIRGEANPYDPAWEESFDRRLGRQWLAGEHRQPLVKLWKAQQGTCLVCHQRITKETGWNIHHLRYRGHGGGDNQTNLALLHPNCHRPGHSRGLTVVRPGTARCLCEA